MSYPVWPFSSVQLEHGSWRRQRQEGRRLRQPDAGPPAARRRFSAVGSMVSLSVILSRSERAIFDRFFDEACHGGTSFFWMPDPMTDGWPLLDQAGRPLLDEDGSTLCASARLLCAWGQDLPVENRWGGAFRLTFNVVVMP